MRNIGPKKRGNQSQTENLKLFLKPGDGPKKRGNEQTENLNLFLKTGNGPKN